MENNDAKIVDFSEDRGHFTGNLTGQITSNIEITLKINSKIKGDANRNDRDFNNFTNGNSGNFNDDIKIKGNNNENFNKNNNENNNENKYIANINSDNCKGIFIGSDYDDYFCKDF